MHIEIDDKGELPSLLGEIRRLTKKETFIQRLDGSGVDQVKKGAWVRGDEEGITGRRISHALSRAAVIKHSSYTVNNISSSFSFAQRLQGSQ